MAKTKNFGFQLAQALRNVLKPPTGKLEGNSSGCAVKKNAQPTTSQHCVVRAAEKKSPRQNPITLDGQPQCDDGVAKLQSNILLAHPATAENAIERRFPAVRQVGQFVCPPQFEEDGGAVRALAHPNHDGIQGQISSNVSNAADLILGLDFGTSSVKAVIRDTVTERAYAVPFFKDSENIYLLPSRVLLSKERFSLDKGDQVLRDLKLCLLDSPVASPILEFEDACAFLALVIRHCRGWLLDEYEPQYRHHQLHWTLNLGLPARSYEDRNQELKFRRLAWAAANLAADSNKLEITRSGAAEYRKLSRELFLDTSIAGLDEMFPFRMQDTDVVPEIAAQLFGFSRSSRWDFREHPMMMLCDIGAGTVDCAFFSVIKQNDGSLKFSFFSDDVQPFGVMNLHRTRVDHIKDALAESGLLNEQISELMDKIRQPTDREIAIPESFADYHVGFEFDFPENEQNFDTDYYFHNFHAQVIRCLRVAKKDKTIPASQMNALPIFLCGGGSRMNFYSQVTNSTSWKLLGAKIKAMQLPLPNDLIAPHLSAGEFDRLSVAYGLAWQGDDSTGESLGDIVRSADIPPMESIPIHHYMDVFIDKDQC